MLKLRNGKLYIGYTINLKNRIEKHKRGYNKYTRNFLPIKLKFYCCFSNKYLAYNFERYLKSGSGRAFISKRLIN